MIACPSAVMLARLGTGSLPVEASDSLEGHVERCPVCQARMNRLVREDAGQQTLSSSLPARDGPPRIPGFVVERELGRGGMSVVYLARQPSLGRLVALKVVRSGPAAGSRDYARWLREARSVSVLRHENVVRLYDAGEADGWLYLVLEYVPGGTLNDRLDVPYAARDAARLLAAVAVAVAAIHRAGLLHLDLKPSNILIDAAPGLSRELETPRVGDFGLAYFWDDPEATANRVGLTGPVGTPRYMAPEQVGAGRATLGPPADVYGLGALLYHVITGRPPFVAPSVAETLDQVCNQEPVPPRRLNPAIPLDLETICMKCLRKQPGQRYATAQAVADDLRRFLEGVAICARPVSWLERSWRRCCRRPAVAALAAALVVSLFAGFLGMFLLWRHAESERHRAETERRRFEVTQLRAEADFRRTAQLLDQLIELNVGVPARLAQLAAPQHSVARLRMARQHLLELASRLPDRETVLYQTAMVDSRLIEALGELGRADELRPLLEEALRHLEMLVQHNPRTVWAWRWQSYDLERLASIEENRGDLSKAEMHLRRSLACVDEWMRVDAGAESFTDLIRHRRSLARCLAIQGRHDEVRSLLLASYHALDECPPHWVDERVMAERVVNRLDFADLEAGPPPAPSVDRAGRPDPATALASSEADRLLAEAWARLAARALGFAEETSLAGSRESQAAFCFTRRLHTMASDQRMRGRLDQATQTADRYYCLGRLLVERNANDPAAYLVLADAYDQLHKNAWRIPDRAAIELNLERSIEATRRALELAPFDETARHQLDRRLRKLENLRHPDRSRPSPVR